MTSDLRARAIEALAEHEFLLTRGEVLLVGDVGDAYRRPQRHR